MKANKRRKASLVQEEPHRDNQRETVNDTERKLLKPAKIENIP